MNLTVRITSAGEVRDRFSLAKEVSGEKSTALGTEPTMVSGSRY